jgi:hypothetical protein
MLGSACSIGERWDYMRRKFQRVSVIACLIWLANGTSPLDAGIRASFDLEGCTWNATHIVMVQTTAAGDVFSVLESLKGDLKPGDLVKLAELKPAENAPPISAYQKSAGFDPMDEFGISGQIPRQPVGSRMIFFLKKQSGVGKADWWEPASPWGGMKVSVLWIDGGKGFCFQQRMNPGPSALSQCMHRPARSSGVAVFTVRIQEVLQAQSDLAQTLALKNEDARAQRLGRIALGDVYLAQKEAIEALGKAGTVALPEILQVLDKPPRFYDGDALIRAFVEAAGKDSGSHLHARLQEDVIYWKTVGPTLNEDWFDQLIMVGSPLFVKFNETVLLVRELDKEHYAPSAQTVAELHDFWVSQPQLYDPKWGERDLRNGGSALEIMRAESFGLAKQCEVFASHMKAK